MLRTVVFEINVIFLRKYVGIFFFENFINPFYCHIHFKYDFEMQKEITLTINMINFYTRK